MSEITLESLAQQLKDLQQEVEVYHRTARRLDQHVEEFKNSNSSRPGLPSGPLPPSSPRRDACIRIVQADGKAQVIDVPSGQVVAEMISVPGPAGKDGRDGVDGKDGLNGRTGLTGPQGAQGEKGDCGEQGSQGKPGFDGVTPDVDEIVEKVVIEMGARLQRS